MALNSFKKDGFLKRGNKFVLTLNCLGTFLLGVILAQSFTKKFLFSVEIARVILLSFAEMQFFGWIPKCCTIRTYFLGRRDLFKTLELLFLCSTLQMTRLSKESCLASQFFLFFGCDPSEFNWTFFKLFGIPLREDLYFVDLCWILPCKWTLRKIPLQEALYFYNLSWILYLLDFGAEALRCQIPLR